MASYTLLWTNETWDKYTNFKRAYGACPIEYVAGDNKRPLSAIAPGDEIFVVTVKKGSLFVAGRLIVATFPLKRREAIAQLGRSDLIEKELFFVGRTNEIDEFRPGCLVGHEIAKNLDLIKVDGSICHPSLDKNGGIDRQAFRSPFKLTERSAETLRSILFKSTEPLRSGSAVVPAASDLQFSAEVQENGNVLVSENIVISTEGVTTSELSHSESSLDLEEVAKKIENEYVNLEGQDVDVIVKRRVGQGIFRKLLLEQFGGACCMTGLTNLRLLIASHIVPWSKSEPAQKLAPENGLLLSVSMDALFDKGLISFSDNGGILIGGELDAEAIGILGLDKEFSLPEVLLTEERLKNLAKHRERHGFDSSI